MFYEITMKTLWENKLRIDLDDIFEDVQSYTGENVDELFDRVFAYSKDFIRAVVKEEKEKLSNFYEDQIEDLRKLADLERGSKK